MKKIFLIFALLSLLLVSAAPTPPIKLVRLTLLNKSDNDIEVKLTGKSCSQFYYYLRVPKGEYGVPVEKSFTIIPDTYSVDTYYVELWDPVYGHKCSDRTATVEIHHTTRIVIQSCKFTPPNKGEPSIVKLGGTGTRHRHCSGRTPARTRSGIIVNSCTGGYR